MEPRAQLENASLIVKRKKCHVHWASGAKFGGRRPKYTPYMTHQSQTSHVLATEIISTAKIIEFCSTAQFWNQKPCNFHYWEPILENNHFHSKLWKNFFVSFLIHNFDYVLWLYFKKDYGTSLKPMNENWMSCTNFFLRVSSSSSMKREKENFG